MLWQSRAQLDVKWMHKFGPIYGYYSFNKPILTVGDPELIKQIWIKDFQVFPNRFMPSADNNNTNSLFGLNIDETTGQHWHRIRQAINPTFTSAKLRSSLIPKIDRCLSQLFNAMQPMVDRSKPIEMKRLMQPYVINIFAASIFSLSIDAHQQPDHPYASHTLVRSLAVRLLPTFLLRSLRMKNESMYEDMANEYFLGLTRHLMAERNNNNNNSTDGHNNRQYNDWLEELMNAKVSDKNNKTDDSTDAKLTTDEILANIWILTSIGFDSTVTTHTYASYELAADHELQSRLYNEIADCSANGQLLDYDRVLNLPLLSAVISETLRKHSHAVRETRIADRDYQLSGTGITVKQGETVELPIYAIHHCPDYYPEPHLFRADRFLPANRHKLIPYTYLPFGLGPRHCLGKQFELMLVKLTLANLIYRYRLTTCAQTDPRQQHNS
ncbi:cytochrome P450 3A41-like [Oppia nitens]|uniref:cytochrome P450 3A41-like n=1 Tax=Oppia nitens TaxID=1686743 RepID=UPI0023DA8CD3|nr:cytochrome P450 3A41-like [Oppia nitens]